MANKYDEQVGFEPGRLLVVHGVEVDLEAELVVCAAVPGEQRIECFVASSWAAVKHKPNEQEVMDSSPTVI